MFHVLGTQKVTANHRETPGGTIISMAHYCNRFILLEQAGFHSGSRCIQQISHGDKNTKVYIICSVHQLSMIVTEVGVPFIIRKPRATKLSQVPSNTGTHNIHNVHKELIRKQGNRPEIEYSVSDPATLVLCSKFQRGKLVTNYSGKTS